MKGLPNLLIVVVFSLAHFLGGCQATRHVPAATDNESWFPNAMLSLEYRVVLYYSRTGRWARNTNELFGPRGFEFFYLQGSRWRRVAVPQRHLNMKFTTERKIIYYEL